MGDWATGILAGHVSQTTSPPGSSSMRAFRLFPQHQLRCYAHGPGRGRPSRLGETVSLDHVRTRAHRLPIALTAAVVVAVAG